MTALGARVTLGRDMQEFEIDESRLPLVRVVYSEVVTVDALKAVFERYVLLSRRHPRIAYLIDLTRYNPVLGPADVRKTTSDLLVRHLDVLSRVTVCEARVVPSALIRAAMVAFDSVTTKKWPCANFATQAEAEAWIQEQLARKAPSRR